MAENYVSRRDKIVASAVELIGDLGLNALTTKNLARKENISETLIYKYFGGIDEVLTEVVVQYAAFDKNIQMTVDHQAGSNMKSYVFMQIHMQPIMIIILVWVRLCCIMRNYCI